MFNISILTLVINLVRVDFVTIISFFQICQIYIHFIIPKPQVLNNIITSNLADLLIPISLKMDDNHQLSQPSLYDVYHAQSELNCELPIIRNHFHSIYADTIACANQ